METPVEYNAGKKKQEIICVCSSVHKDRWDIENYMTKQEAIWKIAEKLQEENNSGKWTLDADFKHAKHFAEVALNVLLGVGK